MAVAAVLPMSWLNWRGPRQPAAPRREKPGSPAPDRPRQKKRDTINKYPFGLAPPFRRDVLTRVETGAAIAVRPDGRRIGSAERSVGGPACRHDIGQDCRLPDREVIKRLSQRGVLLHPAGHGLDEHRLAIVPDDEMGGRSLSGAKFQNLFILLVVGAMIEANHHGQVAERSPAFRQHKIRNLK